MNALPEHRVDVDPELLKRVGRWAGIAHEEYHRNWPGVTHGDVRSISRSFSHYKERRLNPQPSTPAMQFGSAVHSYILERQTFTDRYAVAPADIDRRTKVGREAWDAWLAEHEGRSIISVEDLARIHSIGAAVDAHPLLTNILRNGRAEDTMAWVDQERGLLCKVRPDFYREDENVIVDLKTTEDAREDAFSRSCVIYGYDTQAAMYIDGVTATLKLPVPPSFLFAAVEKSPPHGIRIYKLDLLAIKRGRERVADGLSLLRHYLDEPVEYEGYDWKISDLSLPKWA